MKMRTALFAAALSLSAGFGANAAPDSSLQLTYKTGPLFTTTLSTPDAFWNAFKEVFNATSYSAVASSFSDIVGDLNNFANLVIAYNPTKAQKALGAVTWTGQLKFDGVSTVTLTSSTLNGTVFQQSPTLAVPGPEAGAGLGAAVLAGMAFWATRRKRNLET